ncbi:hypothetical protein CDD83_9290 [Cordyceps sp. RAO-2017]|nr:hypothetical protein CDD83_9290 [Cordyceps sp. RAO-2017]
MFPCGGRQLEDNKANVQSFSPGQKINLKAEIPIPHVGPCDVFVMDTKTLKPIGDALIHFDEYADDKLPQLPANNTNFDVQMPKLPDGQCTQPGQCVLQWDWKGKFAKQSYLSCVDFVVGPQSGQQSGQQSGAAAAGSTTSGPDPAGTLAQQVDQLLKSLGLK